VLALLTMLRIGAAHATPFAGAWQPLAPMADAQTAASTLPAPEIEMPAEDVRAAVEAEADVARDIGRPILVGVLVTLLALALGTAGRHIRWLAWLGRGVWATAIGAASACGEAMIEVAIAGGSMHAVYAVAVAAVLAFWRARRPAPEPGVGVARDRQRGSIARRLMLVLVGAWAVGWLFAFAFAGAGCAWLRSSPTGPVVVDCTTAAARQHADELGPLLEDVIRAATSTDGRVDWVRVRRAVEGSALDVAGCAVVLTIERLLASRAGLVATESPRNLRDGPGELWPGVTFRTVR
jgi:hypothetical protein